MDAQELKLEVKRIAPRVERLVIVWLAAVLAFGLWQGYGVWLLGRGGSHVT